MNLRHLELIVAVCRAGGLSGAARQLQVSQPTLSKAISRVERELGVQLFDRSNGAARPTAVGEFVVERAEPLLHAAASLTREIEHHIRGESGRLTIGVGPATRVRPLPYVIRRVAGAFPGLRIETRQVEGPAVVRGVAEGRYDVAIGNRDNAEPYGDLIRIKLFDDRLAAVVRVGHSLVNHADVDAATLLAFPVASFRIGPAFEQWLGPLNAEQADRLYGFQSDDATLLRDFVLNSDAIAWVPRFIFATELLNGEAVELPLGGAWPYECWLLTTPGHWTSPVMRAIADFAREGAAHIA
jgi:DNA-binding transcriptional LysR family regulator